MGALARRIEEDATDPSATGPDPASGPQVVRRMRSIAEVLSAREFCLFTVFTTAETVRLVPTFDLDFPRISGLTRLCSRPNAEDFVKSVTASTIPALWLGEDCDPTGAARALRWTRRIAPPAPGLTGLAFPLPAERGSGGLAVLSDPLNLTDETICQAHVQCFALVKAISRLRPPRTQALPSLSKRELECLKLTADGMTSDQIAAELGLSVHTANQYLANTTQKLNAVNRMHAVAKALRAGLFD